MQFSIDLQVDDLILAGDAVIKELSDPHMLLLSIGESLFNVNRDRHYAGLAPDGSKWKELSPLTLTQGNRKGGALNKTGRMLQSFNYQVDGDTLLLGFDGAAESKRAEWHHGGTNPYVITPKKKKALKFGGIYAKRVNHPGLPARPLVGFPVLDQKLVKDVARDYLEVILKRVR